VRQEKWKLSDLFSSFRLRSRKDLPGVLCDVRRRAASAEKHNVNRTSNRPWVRQEKRKLKVNAFPVFYSGRTENFLVYCDVRRRATSPQRHNVNRTSNQPCARNMREQSQDGDIYFQQFLHFRKHIKVGFSFFVQKLRHRPSLVKSDSAEPFVIVFRRAWNPQNAVERFGAVTYTLVL